jgi:DNA-binding winged helix-turn-helix (wHTH) protein
MASVHQRPARLAFGAFEVNAAAGELSKGGVRVRLAAQPFQILLVLLERPGELVTREQLREQIWGEDTFVDFEHGLNTAVNKLRAALHDSAENPRYIETLPGRGYRFIGTPSPQPDPNSCTEPSPPAERIPQRRCRRIWLWSGFAVVCAALGFALGWRCHRPAIEQRAPWKFTRLTTDTGLSDTPALSPDGKLVAYSSESDSGDERDLCLKHVGGGQPIRLT